MLIQEYSSNIILIQSHSSVPSALLAVFNWMAMLVFVLPASDSSLLTQERYNKGQLLRCLDLPEDCGLLAITAICTGIDGF